MTTLLDQYRGLQHKEKVSTLKDLLVASEPEEVKTAVNDSTADVQKAAIEGGDLGLAGMAAKDRRTLYLTVIILLAVLAAGALVGAGIALVNGKESAAFFTFAGLALGGITALFVPSPTAR